VRLLAPLPLLFLAACGSSGSGGPSIPFTGTPGEPIAATNVLDTLMIPVTVDGVRGTAIVDTGSPVVLLDPSTFVDAGLPDGGGAVPTLTVGALTFPGAYVVGANLIASPDPSIPLGASLGCGILCNFAVSLDYRDATLTLGASSPPPNVASPGTSVPFTLSGGGSVTISGVSGSVLFPPSRIVVEVTLEGTPHTFVVDTGSSFVTVRGSLFRALVADGRGEISGIGTATVGQQSSSAVTRLRSFGVGGASVAGLVAAEDPSIDATLDSVAAEVGQTIDGLVGGSYLRSFFVTIDYPGSALHLQGYTTGGPTFDTFDRIGVALAPSSGATPPTVGEVLAGTDAAKLGVVTGDVILAVDGHALTGLGETAIDTLLSGPVGSTKSVQFGAASASSLSMATVTIAVDDLLPLP